MDITPYFMAVFIGGIVLYGAVKKVDCLEAFTAGAKEGLSTCIRILPYLCAMLIAVSMLRASGFFDLLVRCWPRWQRSLGCPRRPFPSR